MKMINNLIIILFISTIFYSCETSPYLILEKKELSSGVRYDSLFLGVKFGMSSEEFYSHCWELNKQELIKQGPSNSSVKYLLPTKSNGQNIEMLFYPNFNNDTIFEVNTEFSYTAWAPWNKDLFSDSLIKEIKTLLSGWYKSDFIEIKNPENEKYLYVTVNGNRRITLTIMDDRKVRARFTNLLIEKKINYLSSYLLLKLM